MSVFNCPKCGKELAGEPSECWNCGCKLKKGGKASLFRNSSNKKSAKQAGASIVATMLNLKCPRCGSTNLYESLETIGEKHNGKTEIREKSAITKAGNKTVRAFMTAATAGLWALTPKRSDYQSVSKGKTEYITKKMYHCKDCGHMW